MMILLVACVGSATLIDLDDYILSTGSQTVTPKLAFASRNDTTGNYSAVVFFGEGNRETTILLGETNDSTELNEANFTTDFKKVQKPYPGYLNINSTDDSASYIGKAANNLTLMVRCNSYQEAINLLKEIEVIPRADYQRAKSAELLDSLGGST